MRPIAPSIRMMTVAVAASGATTTLATQPRFVYKLGSSLYVPLTSRCNSLTLPQLRGKGFELPTSVVAALRRVRDAELESHHGNEMESADEWYSNEMHSTDLPSKMKLPPPTVEAVASLPPLGTSSGEREPTVDNLMADIEHEFGEANAREKTEKFSKHIESIVLSGEGEPTLRLEDMVELVQRIKSFSNKLSGQPPPAIRLTTNGLVVHRATSNTVSLPQRLWDSGVSNISVGLMTWNAEQYEDMVRPLLVVRDGEPPGAGFSTVCSFIKEAVNVDGDLVVETTAVDRPDVDKAKTEALAASLGVIKPVRWRPYFP